MITGSETPVLTDMLAEYSKREVSSRHAGVPPVLRDARWAMDYADPINFVPRNGEKRLLMQMVTGDAVIPNGTTLQLGEVSNVSVGVYDAPLLGHMFLANPISPAAIAAKREITDFLNSR